MPAPLIIAHRGASAAEPENSLAAFRRAVAMNADGIELDIHATTDGQLMVHHDPLVDGERIAARSAAEIRRHRLPNGEPIPTLAEALTAAGPSLFVFVEVKTLPPEHDAVLFAALDGGPAPTHYHVHGFDHRIIKRLHGKRPQLTCGVLSASYLLDPLAPLTNTGATEYWQDAGLIDADLVKAVHGAKALLHAWTVDDPAQARALTALGVDGLCTNKPDVIRRALA